MDCVVSYHLNPATCGVAKFNAILAEQLGVPLVGIFDDAVLTYREPLLSLKITEFTPDRLALLDQRLRQMLSRQSVRLFLHIFGNTAIERELLREARVVYCGNPELRTQVSSIRPDAVELWCPGTILSHDRFLPSELSVFSFGMAHKVRADSYVKLHRLLEATGKSYSLYISTALHENTSFDESFDGAFEEIRKLFSDNVHFVGFLSDAAVYNKLLECTYFSAFFETGVRSNNTSVNTAMSCGSVVITNLDTFSPGVFQHGQNVLDIARLDALPTEPAALKAIGSQAKTTAHGALGWNALVSAFETFEAAERGARRDSGPATIDRTSGHVSRPAALPS